MERRNTTDYKEVSISRLRRGSTPFSDQLWTICMELGKSATNFDRPHAESCTTGRRNAEPPKLPALFPNCMHCRLNWPEKDVVPLTHRSALPQRDGRFRGRGRLNCQSILSRGDIFRTENLSRRFTEFTLSGYGCVGKRIKSVLMPKESVLGSVLLEPLNITMLVKRE